VGTYRIQFHQRAARDFERLPSSVRRRFYSAFEHLAADPYRARPLCDIRRLKGERGVAAIRVGAYRGTFMVVGDSVWFLTFAHRKIAYRG
jgi:mRNA-degrading endonuclease RelE of RelBE toxin-antitoxin system